MTAFQLWTLALLTAGILILAAAVWLDWRHNNAITQRDSTKSALDLANQDLAQTKTGLADAYARFKATNELGTNAWHAWQAAGGRGRTTPERELLEQFAPHDPGADQ